MGRFLTVLEVSQKQAYIFRSNKMKENIERSAVIDRVTSSDYFKSIIQDDAVFQDSNVVYSGGGHTVLEFASMQTAVCFCKKVTSETLQRYGGLKLFAKTVEYDEKKTIRENLEHLIAELERKKSIRRNAFHQGSFGVEETDATTMEPKRVGVVQPESKCDEKREFIPKGYDPACKFEDLGGSKDDSNFIAVVHIDGNAMGKRMDDFYDRYKELSWDELKKKLGEFSKEIDKDFKGAFEKMVEQVAENLESEKGEDYPGLNRLSLLDHHFPVRKIIAAGDDICFVTEGRIGIECAAAFLKALAEKNNEVDGQFNAACAGIALVHQKYPFYRAYELAEELCRNAKRYGASLSEGGDGRDISCMDWHIEYGEMGDTLTEIRKQYEVSDMENCRLELRPYIVHETLKAPQHQRELELRSYNHFRKLVVMLIRKDYEMGRGRLKNLRTVLKQGEAAVKNYIQFHKLQESLLDTYYGKFVPLDTTGIGSGTENELPVYVSVSESAHERRSYLFDAIEMMDTFLVLKEGEKDED